MDQNNQELLQQIFTKIDQMRSISEEEKDELKQKVQASILLNFTRRIMDYLPEEVKSDIEENPPQTQEEAIKRVTLHIQQDILTQLLQASIDEIASKILI